MAAVTGMFNVFLNPRKLGLQAVLEVIQFVSVVQVANFLGAVGATLGPQGLRAVNTRYDAETHRWRRGQASTTTLSGQIRCDGANFHENLAWLWDGTWG